MEGRWAMASPAIAAISASPWRLISSRRSASACCASAASVASLSAMCWRRAAAWASAVALAAVEVGTAWGALCVVRCSVVVPTAGRASLCSLTATLARAWSAVKCWRAAALACDSNHNDAAWDACGSTATNRAGAWLAAVSLAAGDMQWAVERQGVGGAWRAGGMVMSPAPGAGGAQLMAV